MVNIMHRCSMDFSTEYFITAGIHTTNDIGIVVIHVGLDIPRWYLAAVVVDNMEGDIGVSPVMLEPYRWL